MTRPPPSAARPPPPEPEPAAPIRVEPCGDAWVMVDWGPHPQANVAARALAARLRTVAQPFCAEAVAGVRTLAVRIAVDDTAIPRAHQREAALDWLRATASEALGWQAPAGGQVVLPACYDPSMAPDLDEVAAATGLTTAEVVAIHSGCTFTAEVVGFMPGFAYLGGLDPRLKLDRRTVPRPRVPEGGIAIAGLQTAIYPSPTAGGWHLIGRCPLRLFDPDRSPPALMTEGDTIRFEPIDKAEFDRLLARR
jgi:KipI family sensor histidine kinase inhibitor